VTYQHPTRKQATNQEFKTWLESESMSIIDQDRRLGLLRNAEPPPRRTAAYTSHLRYQIITQHIFDTRSSHSTSSIPNHHARRQALKRDFFLSDHLKAVETGSTCEWFTGLLDFKQVWSFFCCHVGLAPLIRRGTHYA
jgi:hypothetical protein